MDSRITFIVSRIGNDMCRITANYILDEVRKIADGGCICSLDVMLDEMEHITTEVREKFNEQAVFEFVG